MNKRIFLVLVLLAVLLVACGKQPAPATPAPQTDTAPAPETPSPPPLPPVPAQSAPAASPTASSEAAPQTSIPPSTAVKEFTVTARQFEFDPATITVSRGDDVRLKITSQDVTHGFSISEYGVNERLDPHKEVVVEFTADKQGEFSFFCSIPCGSGHGGMNGKLIVR
ncbi:cupredoxin domain-containing protein [Candidatus Woesearchaeota archaeon]|nr:cupredoxin domain-containing protein [Candidatus Woesearchaeota archaeon]